LGARVRAKPAGNHGAKELAGVGPPQMKPHISFPLALCLFALVSACSTRAATVVETHSLILVVEDPAASLAQLRALARYAGGFVEDSSVSFSVYEVPRGAVYQATFTMRVPPRCMQGTLAQMEDGAIEIAYHSYSRQDFTLEHDLLESRRAEFEHSRDRLLNLIDEKYAQPTDAELANDLLQALRTELHSVESRIGQLENESSLSYIYVELIPIEVRQLTVPDS